MKGIAVALDGPVASGKSTIARLLADNLGFLYLDTGAMYRAITLLALRNRISPQDRRAVIQLAKEVKLTIKSAVETELGYRIWVREEELTGQLHSPEVNEWVSYVSEIPEVRAILVAQQRNIAEKESIVVAGRDIGTTVLPEAQVKFFLTADLHERARRRFKELQEKGIDQDLADVLANVQSRDRIDSQRSCSPLQPAADAVWFDSTNLTVPEVVLALEKIVREKTGQ